MGMKYQTIPEIVDVTFDPTAPYGRRYRVVWPDRSVSEYDPDRFLDLFEPVETSVTTHTYSESETVETEIDVSTLESDDDNLRIIKSTTYFVPKGYCIKEENGKLSIKPYKDEN